MSERVFFVVFYLFLVGQGFNVECRPFNISDTCQRSVWVVNTTEDLIGYKVVAPAQLDLGLCTGSCPFPATGERTMHREVLDRFRNLYPGKIPVNWEYSQCNCKSFKPVSMIVEILGKYEKKDFNFLTIETCGCS